MARTIGSRRAADPAREDERLRRRALDRVARIEEQRRDCPRPGSPRPPPRRGRAPRRGRRPASSSCGCDVAVQVRRWRIVRVTPPREPKPAASEDQARSERELGAASASELNGRMPRAWREKPREPSRQKKRAAAIVLRRLAKAYPGREVRARLLERRSSCSSRRSSRRSARTSRVNMVTPHLFAKYRTAADYARSPEGRARARDPLDRVLQLQGEEHPRAPAPRSPPSTAAGCPTPMEALAPAARRRPQDGQRRPGQRLRQGRGLRRRHARRPARAPPRLHAARPTRSRSKPDLNALVPKGRRTMGAHLLIAHGRNDLLRPEAAAASDCPVEPPVPENRRVAGPKFAPA